MNIKLAIQLFQNMGPRYVGYRIAHEFQKRTGLLKKKHPMNPEIKSGIALAAWKSKETSFIIDARETLTIPLNPNEKLKEKAQKILKGEICFFSLEWKNLGANYDWVTNPETGFKYDSTKHWSEINDFNAKNGDIKYVWEKSRFSYLLTIMRYDYHFNQDNAAFVFSEIESWINANPVNQGPNWKCSQEISLRTINWLYVLYFYKNSKELTTERWNKIQNNIYWSLHHVYHHIDFSRIAVRNNHAITETLMLTISELLFPFFPETKKWAKDGRKYFEQEIAYQIYDDGTFLQFSMNYHRVVIQLLSLGISITEKNQKPFSSQVYTKAYKSLNFLYQCLQEENGYLPNYGANDGAWFFPLSDSDYRDYRQQLNTLHTILTQKNLYVDAKFMEDAYWVMGEGKTVSNQVKKSISKITGTISFETGGYYLFRTSTSFTFLRCGNHKDRPSHADNLHLDVWVQGENVLRDSGTYKYNTAKKYQAYFSGSQGHNTVSVDGQSQMLKGSRFIWYFWSQAKEATWSETEDTYIFKGAISAFRFINPKCIHTRTVEIAKNDLKWVVTDEVQHTKGLTKSQIWHTENTNWDIKAVSNNKVISTERGMSYNSSGYGQKLTGNAIVFKFKDNIQTTLLYKDKKR